MSLGEHSDDSVAYGCFSCLHEMIINIHSDTPRDMFSTQIFFFSTSVLTGQQRLLYIRPLP